MNRSITLAMAGVCLSLLSPFTAAANDPLLIENVTLLSPELAQPLGNRHVLIRDGRIATVSDRAIPPPPGTRRLDGTGKFLTPGITDAHVHVSDAVGLPFGSADPEVAALEKEFFAQQPRSYLYFGVTQLLDTANRPERVADFAAQKQHPDIYRCGVVPVVDGYPLVFVDKAIRHTFFNDYIYELANAANHPLPEGANPAEHTPEAVVARVRAATKKHGLLLAVHANALDMQQMAVAGNVDLILHGIWNWNQLNDSPGIPPAVDQHLRNLRDRKIGYQATLRVLPGVTELLDPALLDDPVYPKVVPARLLAWYRTEPAQWFKRMVFGPNVDAAAVLAGERAANERWATSEKGMRALRHLYELGQPMLLGSDTPSAPTYGNQPGYDTFKEMRMMAQVGIPLSAIFAAATINNARQLGLEKDYGTIEKGKVANLLLLEANPLASVAAWAKIDTVILRGEPIERETLAANAKR